MATETPSSADGADVAHVCHTCGRSFRRHSVLQRHVAEHSVTRLYKGPSAQRVAKITVRQWPYRCPVCGRSFNNGREMAVHVNRSHWRSNGRQPCPCRMCPKAVWSRVPRSKVDVRQCPVCGKVLASHANMIVHVRKHTGERPFQCKMCSKAYTSRGGLTKHEIHRHPGPESSLRPVRGAPAPRPSVPTLPAVPRSTVAAVARPTMAVVPRPTVPRPIVATVPRPTVTAVPRPTVTAVTTVAVVPPAVAVVPPAVAVVPPAVVARPTVVMMQRPTMTMMAVVPNPTVATVPRPTMVAVARPMMLMVARPKVVAVGQPTVVSVARPMVVAVPRPTMVAVPSTLIVTVPRPTVAAAPRPVVMAEAAVACPTEAAEAVVPRPTVTAETVLRRPTVATAVAVSSADDDDDGPVACMLPDDDTVVRVMLRNRQVSSVPVRKEPVVVVSEDGSAVDADGGFTVVMAVVPEPSLLEAHDGGDGRPADDDGEALGDVAAYTEWPELMERTREYVETTGELDEFLEQVCGRDEPPPQPDELVPTLPCVLDPTPREMHYRRVQAEVTDPVTGAKRYRCDVCCATVKHFVSWRKHMVRHGYVTTMQLRAPRRPHPCDKCPAVMRNRELFREHMRTAHPRPAPENKVVCPLCRSVRYGKLSLILHARFKHGFPPGPCFACTIPSEHRAKFGQYLNSHLSACKSRRRRSSSSSSASSADDLPASAADGSRASTSAAARAIPSPPTHSVLES